MFAETVVNVHGSAWLSRLLRFRRPQAALSVDGERRDAGYLLVPHDKVEETYNAGFSVYAAPGPC